MCNSILELFLKVTILFDYLCQHICKPDSVIHEQLFLNLNVQVLMDHSLDTLVFKSTCRANDFLRIYRRVKIKWRALLSNITILRLRSDWLVIFINHRWRQNGYGVWWWFLRNTESLWTRFKRKINVSKVNSFLENAINMRRFICINSL